tara:strand:- start:439 stop:1854 length:1416 start_codon:yes stop_codon:yes gene_type:complete
MAQHDYDIANQSGANFRADLNNALDAIVSNNSGSNEPSTKFAYEWWVDTTNDLLKIRNSANNAWITLPLSVTADNSTSGALTVNGNLTTTGSIDINGQELILDADADTSITADSDDQIDFRVGAVDVMTLTNSHLVLKGTTPKITIGDGGEEDTALIFDGNAQDFYIGLDDSADDLIIGTGSTVGTNPIFAIKNNGNIGIDEANPTEKLELGDGSTTNRIRIDSATKAHFFGYDGTDDAIQLASQSFIKFQSGASFLERMRIDSSGNLLVGKTSLNNATIGTEIKFSGGLINVTNSSTQCMIMNRLTSDGSLVLFQQDTTTEGSISVNGATVSYNGFSGNHESSGIASDTAIGTVCSTIDELDTYVSGTKEGQTRTDHPKIKVSDTEGDSRVYGVLSSYSEEDNKPIVASVGIGSVLVTGACAGGDLLESNGDGTAKVQDDDIIRSKTIGKVTIGNSDTNVKLVSCVLYCG